MYLRYFYPMKLSQRVEHERLARICFIDYDREMALVAQMPDGQIAAAGRIIKLTDSTDAEYAILVADAFQRQGLGTEMLRRLVEIAKQEGVERIFGNVLYDNTDMLRVTERLGFHVQGMPKDGVMRVMLEL